MLCVHPPYTHRLTGTHQSSPVYEASSQPEIVVHTVAKHNFVLKGLARLRFSMFGLFSMSCQGRQFSHIQSGTFVRLLKLLHRWQC